MSHESGPRAQVRIAEVARMAGVSVATVSRTLANPDVVTKQTRQKVLSAVRESGYTPNVVARNLRVKKSMMALVVVPDIGNAFFSEVLRGIDETLSAEGYGLIIADLDNSASKEARYVDLVCAGQVDGVMLLCGHVISGRDRSLRDANVPIVAACERIAGEQFPQVEVDNRNAAGEATKHLIALGRRRIGYITGPEGSVLEAERGAGYRNALESGGLAIDTRLVFPGDFTFAAGQRAAAAVLAMPESQRPTAVFAANDEMAFGFQNAIQQAGLSVPGDIAVAGFDGIAYADFCQPALTTVVQPRRELGSTAASILADMMKGREVDARLIELKANLIVRESSVGGAASAGE